jgi:hypothetical protein
MATASNLYAHLYDEHMAEKAELLGAEMRGVRHGGALVELAK